jgi:uncharacterized tellurite resistance protein B-like protein
MPTNSEYLLTVYLNDHLAGATAGVALARRLARNHQGTAFQQQTADLAEQIMQDRRSLLEIMEALNIRPRKIKGALALLAERAGRLKLNGALFRRSALSSVTELEGMRLGVEGKTDGWQALRHIAHDYTGLDAAKLDHLLHRAGQQSNTLQNLRLQAAADAFVR